MLPDSQVMEDQNVYIHKPHLDKTHKTSISEDGSNVRKLKLVFDLLYYIVSRLKVSTCNSKPWLISPSRCREKENIQGCTLTAPSRLR